MQIEQHPIEPIHQTNLREWLHQPHFDTLIQVLSSLAFVKEAQAASELTQWGGGEFPQYRAAALKTSMQCADLKRTIEVLKTLREQKEPYIKATANPN